MMNNLTQDWKDGKLKEGLYYVQFPRGDVLRCKLSEVDKFFSANIKILAEVPDYNLWMNLWNTADMVHKTNNNLLEYVEQLERQVNHLRKTQAWQFLDNQKLQVKAKKAKDVIDFASAKKNKQLEEKIDKFKELLRECYNMLAQYHVKNSEPSLDENIQLLTKIDNAIGEKK